MGQHRGRTQARGHADAARHTPPRWAAVLTAVLTPVFTPVAAALLVAALVTGTLLAGCGTDGTAAAPSHDPPLVAWINQGVVGSEVWTDAHARAAAAIADELGPAVRTEFVEGVDPGAATATIDRLVADGAALVIATSQPLEAAMVDAARRHPGVRFAQARGSVTTPNLGTFSGADEEPLHLAGMAAAATSTTGRIGFVGTVPEPETLRHVNAFTLGARAVDPTAQVVLAWMGSWWDPATEEALGRRLLDDGADVLVSGSISPVLGDLARTTGTAWVAHDADRSAAYPDVWVAAAVPDWTDHYRDQVAALLAGRWAPADYYGSMADGFTRLAPLGEVVPEPARSAVEQRAAELRAGRYDVFAGPVTDRSGVQRVAPGATLDPVARRRIDWLVDGVVDGPTGPG